MIHVYRINDCEWWAGSSLDEVCAAASRGEPVLDVPVELSPAELDRLEFYDTSGRRLGSFADRLSVLIALGANFPCFFATSEF